MSRGPPAASAGPKLSFKVTFCAHRRQSRERGDRRSSIDLDLSTMKRVSISGRSDDDKLGGGGGGGYEGRGSDGRGRGACACPHSDANWVKWRKLNASMHPWHQSSNSTYPISQPRRRVSNLTQGGRVVSGGDGGGG